MHKSATKCNETLGKWCKNKHGASKIIDTLETYHRRRRRPILGDKSLYSGTLPGQGIAPGATSIDSTAISIDVAVSHDEEGVVLPRG
jgi:hypothetical protein